MPAKVSHRAAMVEVVTGQVGENRGKRGEEGLAVSYEVLTPNSAIATESKNNIISKSIKQ